MPVLLEAVWNSSSMQRVLIFFFYESNNPPAHKYLGLIWSEFASGRLRVSFVPQVHGKWLFLTEEFSKTPSLLQPLGSVFQPSPFSRAGCRKFWISWQSLIREGLSPQNWSSFVTSWCLLPDWFPCLILFPNLSSFVFSLLTLRYHFLRSAGLPPLFQQLSVCSFKSLLKTKIFQEIHPPPLSLIISPASFFIISPLSCSLFSCQTFCEFVCSDCSLSYILFKYMLWNIVHIRH